MIMIMCNASADVGMGHLVRCRALGRMLHQMQQVVVMYGPSLKYRIIGEDDFFFSWVERSNWRGSREEALELLVIGKAHKAKIFILDDYRVDSNFQKIIYKSRIRCLKFDKAAEETLWSDLILSANPALEPSDYEGKLINPNGKLLLGPEYAILREEFTSSSRTKVKVNKEKNKLRVLLTFGGGNDKGATIKMLEVLNPITSADLTFVIVSSSNNSSNDEIKKAISSCSYENIELHISPNFISEIFKSCDFAIMAGGTSTYEAVACNLPMLIVSIAKNQISQSIGWEARGVGYYLGEIEKIDVIRTMIFFKKLVEDEELRLRLKHNCNFLVDGCGARRVAEKLISINH